MVSTPASDSTGRPWCIRIAPTVRVPGPPSRIVCRTAPFANRSSGKSVAGSTMTCPRWPCARAMRPTSTMSSQRTTTLPHVGVADLERRLDPVMVRGGGDERAQGFGRAPLPADYLADIARRDGQLYDRDAPVRGLGDLDIRGVIDERTCRNSNG